MHGIRILSIKTLEFQVMNRSCESTEMNGMVQSLEFLIQEHLKKMPDNNKSRGKYVEWMIKDVPKRRNIWGLTWHLTIEL